MKRVCTNTKVQIEVIVILRTSASSSKKVFEYHTNNYVVHLGEEVDSRK
jgi:hypothetical protein